MVDPFEFIRYWQLAGWEKFLRVFWFFFLFEFTRYVLIDYLVLIFYYLKRKVHKSDWEDARTALHLEQPLVSVIVPGKNEGKHLFKLVKSLSEQTYQNLELIVVDDGSDDQTALIGRDLERNGLIDLFLSNKVRGGKASGANAALTYAKGKYIVHLDADCSFDRDAVEEVLLPFYYDPKIGAVGGNLEVCNHEESIATTLQAIEYLKVILTGRMVTSTLGIYRIISGAFGAFRADILHRLGGWDIGPGLDGDITVKIRKLGYRVYFQPSAHGLTSVPNTFQKLAKQRLRWDKSIIRFRVRKHRDIFYPNEQFRFSNFFSSLENIGYNVVMNIKWFIYLIDIVVNFSGLIKFILPMNILLYSAANFVQFSAIMLIVQKPKEKRKLILYLPLMVFYTGYFLRIVRTMAHFKELFFLASYKDPWNPYKSSRMAKQLGI